MDFQGFWWILMDFDGFWWRLLARVPTKPSPSWSQVRTGPDVFVEFVPHLAKRICHGNDGNGKLFIDDYPLVMTNIAIENGHRNSEFSHWKWWFSIVMLVYQRVMMINDDHLIQTLHFCYFLLMSLMSQPCDWWHRSVFEWRSSTRLIIEGNVFSMFFRDFPATWLTTKLG